MAYPTHNTEVVPKKIPQLYQGRIRQFSANGGQYAELNLPRFYDRQRVHDNPDHVSLKVWSAPDMARPLFKDAVKQAEWTSAKIGDSFGPSWSTHWFKVEIKVPTEWAKLYNESPVFDWDSSDEALVYHSDGTVAVALNAEHNRREWILPKQFLDGASHIFYVETACNNITGTGTPPDMNRYFRLNRADLVVPHEAARALSIDYWIIGDAAREFPESSWQKWRAFSIANQICNVFDNENADETIEKCRKIATEYLGSLVDSPMVYNGEKGLVTAIGNCHIDTAWLWPYAETRRKVARSWASQLDLLERYPEYVFAASQAVQFQWLKEDYPELYSRVQSAGKKGGRFIPIGGSWVECDTNMPSGEALSRQLWLGQKFFEREFGQRSEVFWLPDTFGYSPQIPQLCRLAGMPFFLTQKLSWNNVNVFPHTTFNWVGLDGSQVLCHMPPANTYTAAAHFGDVKRSLENHKNLDTDNHALLLYGYGDGGGGPTAEMIEKLRRCRGLSDTNEALLPRVESGPTPAQFYETILDSSHNGKDLVSWEGELYLEYHRGTYTTQAKVKQSNRRSEILLRDVELFSTAASIKTGYKYPYEDIQRLWEKVCLNQFHDVLPGSGIEMIYEDAHKIYAEVFEKGSKLARLALEALGYSTASPDEAGAERICSLSWVTTPCGTPASTKETGETAVLENDFLRVKFDCHGLLVSVYDKSADREVLTEPGNTLWLYEDQPMNFPAWDTEQYATEKGKKLIPSSIQVEDDHIKLQWHISHESSATQRVYLRKDYIEFDTEVDWHEIYQFLKVEFPVDVRSTVANYECAFGIQQRPTHYNTSWDAAKFEVCGHKFADISEYGYGVSLLNDSKYGYSVHGNRMRLSLLRAPKSPDAHADMGNHHFRYALAPHSGPLGPKTVRLAQEFNHPGHWVRKSVSLNGSTDKPALNPHVVMVRGDPSIFISAVKRADADAGADRHRVIVRVYEALGGKARGFLASLEPVKRAKRVSLLEDELAGDELDILSEEVVDKVPISLNPFEVQTILIELA